MRLVTINETQPQRRQPAPPGVFDHVVSAAITRLQSALTPKTGEDVGVLLKLFVPDGGGIDAVKQLLVDAAKEKGQLVKNTAWFNQLFSIFGIDDAGAQRQILDQVGHKQQKQPKQLPPNQQAQSSSQDAIKQKQIDLAGRLERLRAKYSSESVNKPLTETSKFSNILDKGRALLANPEFAKQKALDKQQAYDNQRIGKLAIYLATTHLRQLFTNKLTAAGIQPAEAIKIMQIVHSYLGKPKDDKFKALIPKAQLIIKACRS